MIHNHPSVDMKVVNVGGTDYLLSWTGTTLTALDVTDPAAPVSKFENKLVTDETRFGYIHDVMVSGAKVLATIVERNRKEYDGFIVWSRYINMNYSFNAVVVDITTLFA